MTIKKLTVAAAIAVGIATCSFSSAMAACPCQATQPACPCPTVTTPATAPCPICGLSQETCGCKQQSCAPACPAPCEKPAEPACATCPNTSCDKLDMKQVYGYPNAIYGDNNYVGEQTNSVYSTETAWMLDRNENLAANGLGVCSGAAAPLSHNACGCGCKSPEMANSGVLVTRGCDCNSVPQLMGAAAPCSACDLPIITGAAASIGGHGCATTIGTPNSITALRKSFTSSMCGAAAPCAPCTTGAAASLIGVFPDVPNGYWAECAIDRLAATNVAAGYPDRTFKPSLPVSRAEFASLLVKGFNLNIAGCDCLPTKKIFKDVPLSHWANPVIAKAVEQGIMAGYKDGKFKPKAPVSRTEALTALAHGINCEMDSCQAQSILSKYCDGNKVPDWATIPVAKALETGVLKDSPNPNTINPCKDASRADIASMLQSVRIAAGYDKDPTPTASNSCDCQAAAPLDTCKKVTYVETEEVVKVPTLKLKFLDEINAKSSHVGQHFAAKTTEEITINGTTYACGSRVNGKIVEVIRPSGCNKGALKVAFTSIVGCDGCKVDLPRQVISAQISCDKKQNAVARFVAMPFTLLGGLVGTVGRTTGGMISSLGNAVESVSGGVGIASSEVFQGQFRAAGRSLQDAGKEAIIAPVDFTRTALSGTIGLFQSTSDEVAFLVDPSGNKISAINPKENVTIAFGCH